VRNPLNATRILHLIIDEIERDSCVWFHNLLYHSTMNLVLMIEIIIILYLNIIYTYIELNIILYYEGNKLNYFGITKWLDILSLFLFILSFFFKSSLYSELKLFQHYIYTQRICLATLCGFKIGSKCSTAIVIFSKYVPDC